MSLIGMLHPGGTSHARQDEEGEGEGEREEEVEKMEEEVEDDTTTDDEGDKPNTYVGLIGHTQHSKAPRRKKAIMAGSL